jgi:hypothetical protein
MAQQATRRKRRSENKTLTLHHHHAKPYRKRHVGLLVVSVVALVLLAAIALGASLITPGKFTQHSATH